MNLKDLFDITNKDISMTSLNLCKLINELRLEEGNSKVKEHKDFMKSIRNELETLKQLGFNNGGNISLVDYTDKKGEKRPCYLLNKQGIMQMLNKESAYVRYKTQQYIDDLENFIYESSLTEDYLYYRRTGKLARRDLTDTIQKYLKPTDKFTYSNYTNLIYKTLYGKSASELKRILNLSKKDNLRDKIPQEHLHEIRLLEDNVRSFIMTFKTMKYDNSETYKAVKDLLKDYEVSLSIDEVLQTC